MEFCDVVNEYCRMCDAISIKGGCPMECDMEGFNRGQCDRYFLREPEKAEKIVKKWSEAHPITVEEAIKQLRWYFKEDDGLAADEKTKKSFDILENEFKRNGFKKDKIIKGLEICTSTLDATRCHKCLYKNAGVVCKVELMRDALNYIRNENEVSK